jgi:hypothetical protein
MKRKKDTYIDFGIERMEVSPTMVKLLVHFQNASGETI